MTSEDMNNGTTYSYKKVDHKKYVKGKVDLLSNIVAPFLASLNLFTEIKHSIYTTYKNSKTTTIMNRFTLSHFSKYIQLTNKQKLHLVLYSANSFDHIYYEY